MVFVGNKLDCSQERVVSEPDVYEAALKRSAAYVETSAKDKTNVQDVFMALIIKTLIPNEPKNMQKHNSRRLGRLPSITLRRSSSIISETSVSSSSQEHEDLRPRGSFSSDTSCSITEQEYSDDRKESFSSEMSDFSTSTHNRLKVRSESEGGRLRSCSTASPEKHRKCGRSCSFESHSTRNEVRNEYRRSSTPCFLESSTPSTPSEYDHSNRCSPCCSVDCGPNSDKAFAFSRSSCNSRTSDCTPASPGVGRCRVLKVTSPGKENHRRYNSICLDRSHSPHISPPREKSGRRRSSSSCR